jgi:hypothetical protein
MMLAMGLLAMQWMARDRLLSRPVLFLLTLPTLGGLIVSLSRGSWVGLVAGVAFVGVLRYRWLLVWLLLGLVVVVVSPPGQALVERFVGGFSSADPATALRLGEYRNALTLIQRYPLLGIGFGPSPDIDVTAGVSSVYLLVGEQMGLVGLLAYVVLLGSVLFTGVRAMLRTPDARLQGILASLTAAFTAALVAGLLDHYFANQVFPHAVALFWLYGACIVAAARQANAAGPDPA